MSNVQKSNSSHFILLANIIMGEDCDCVIAISETVAFHVNFRKQVPTSMEPQQTCDTNFIKSVNTFSNACLPLN